MEGRGMSYYQMHRGWMDHAVFRNAPYSQRDAWCWLIENAVWKKVRTPVEGGIVTLQRGQLAYSLRYLAKAWKWRSDKKVRVFLRHLQDDGMVLFSKSPKTDAGKDAGRSVITICNYDRYQVAPEQVDAPQDAPRTHQGRKEEEVKEESRSDAKSVKGILFNEGMNWIAEKTGKPANSFRGLIGRWIRDHGDGPVFEAIDAAQKEDPIDPVPWITACLQKRNNGNGGGSFQAPPAWASVYATDPTP
jgi:hypothetical protein